MKREIFKGLIAVMMFVLLSPSWSRAQELKVIKLAEPSKKGGLSAMEAFSKRASVRSWSDKDLSSQDLSDLLWAANGINRPETKMRTAPSAGNAQEVDIYVFRKDGVFLYDASGHSLTPVVSGDHRSEIGQSMGGGPSSGGQGSSAPVVLVHVADFSKYGFGSDEQHSLWAAIDVGIVSQNVAIACAAKGMVTRPMVNINQDALKTLLKLSDKQQIILRQPVGYPPDAD